MMRESGAHQLDGSKEGPRGRILPWLVLLVVVISGVYGQVVTFDFLTWDDPHHITENPRLNPVSWESVAQFWTEPYWGLYIPLSYTFFAAEATIAQAPESSQAGNGGEEGGARVTALNPAVFHFGSLLLHLVCVVLVFLVLHKLTDHAGAACMAALLFGLHPVQVESIAWVSETRGLLCAAFSLLAIRLFMLFSEKHDVENVSLRDRSKTEQRQKMGDHATRAIVWYFAATLCFLLALLAKPAAVAVPLLVGVLAIGWLRMPVVRVFSMLGPWLLLAAAWALLTRHVQPATELPFIAPWWSRPLLAGDALAFYLLKVVAPWPCGPDYGYNPQWMMGQWWFYYGWILPVVVAVLLFRAKHRRVWLTAAGLSVFWLLPVLGFIPFIYQRISMVADRYLYLAMLGPALMAAWVLTWTWNRRYRCWLSRPRALGSNGFCSNSQLERQ